MAADAHLHAHRLDLWLIAVTPLWTWVPMVDGVAVTQPGAWTLQHASEANLELRSYNSEYNLTEHASEANLTVPTISRGSPPPAAAEASLTLYNIH